MGKHVWYTYRDMDEPGKIRHTRGVFVGWWRDNLFGIPRAVFALTRTEVLIPHYLLTPETRQAIPPMPSDMQEDAR